MNERIPEKSAGLLERDIGDAVVIMSEKGDRTHTLKGSALFIWRLIDGKNSASAIVREMIDEYDVDPQKAESDLTLFLNELKEKELVAK